MFILSCNFRSLHCKCARVVLVLRCLTCYGDSCTVKTSRLLIRHRLRYPLTANARDALPHSAAGADGDKGRGQGLRDDEHTDRTGMGSAARRSTKTGQVTVVDGVKAEAR